MSYTEICRYQWKLCVTVHIVFFFKWNTLYIFTPLNSFGGVFVKNIGFYEFLLGGTEITNGFMSQNKSIRHKTSQSCNLKTKLFHQISSKILPFHLIFLLLPNGTFSILGKLKLVFKFFQPEHSVVRFLSK